MDQARSVIITQRGQLARWRDDGQAVVRIPHPDGARWRDQLFPASAIRWAMSQDDAILRWPRIISHIICHSLGYATPRMAASVLLAARRGQQHHCEWIASCYGGDPMPAVMAAIRDRHHHRGYMADYSQARRITAQAAAGAHPLLASWM